MCVVITWCLSVQVSHEATSVNQRLMQRVEELSGQLAVLQYAVQGIGMRACLFMSLQMACFNPFVRIKSMHIVYNFTYLCRHIQCTYTDMHAACIWMDAHEDSAKYATQKYHMVCTRKHDTNVYIHVFMTQMCANTQ